MNLNDTAKLIPRDIETEKSLLGILMIEYDKFSEIKSIINSNDFYLESHKIIYKAIEHLNTSTLNSDFMEVANFLKKSNQLETAGGYFYITTLTKDVVSSASLIKWAAVVKSFSIARQSIETIGNSLSNFYSGTHDPIELLEKTITKLENIKSFVNAEKINTLAKQSIDVFNDAKNAKNNVNQVIGIKTGYDYLDEKMLGLTDEDFTIIAANSSEGKSTLALNIAQHATLNECAPGLIFSYEMSAKRIAQIMLSSASNNSVKSIRTGVLNSEGWQSLEFAKDEYQKTPIYINDNGALYISELCSIARMMARKHGVKYIIVDYLQLVSLDVKLGNREQEVAYIAKTLKNLQMELKIPIIALSQLTTDKSVSSPYQLADLRDSKAIGHFANNVIFIFRPIMPQHNRNVPELTIKKEIEGKFHPFKFTCSEDDAIISLGKCRGDSVGSIRAKFYGNKSKIVEYKGIEVDTLITNDIPSNKILKNKQGSADMDAPF